MKKFVIAGAGGLLGVNLTRALMENGACVVATDLSIDIMRERFAEAQIDLTSERLTIEILDVTNEVEVKAFFQRNESVDGAVNCSYPRNEKYGASLFDVTLASFNENVSLHLGAAFLFTQQCAAYFKRHSTPFSLVNISSIYGVIAPKFDIYNDTEMTMPVEYAAIKSAILHLNKYVANFVNDSAFRVNSVSPGGIYAWQPEQFLQNYKKYTNGKGMLDVKDILGSILFLLGQQSAYINGQNIIIDDGFCDH